MEATGGAGDAGVETVVAVAKRVEATGGAGNTGVVAVVVSFAGSGNCSTLDAGVVEA